MSDSVEFRPRFKYRLNLSPEEITALIERQLQNENPADIRWRSAGYHLVLRTPPETRHFWSPQMDINLLKEEDGTTTVRGLIGPLPTVWTMYVFFYAVLGLGGLTALMLGGSQFALGKNPWAWWLVPISLVGSLLMALFAQFGKKLADKEMRDLKNVVEQALLPHVVAESASMLADKKNDPAITGS